MEVSTTVSIPAQERTGAWLRSCCNPMGSAPGFDSRDAQYLLGWNTTNHIPAGQGANSYLIRRARVTLTIALGNQYTYRGTLRDYRTYFPTNDPRQRASKFNRLLPAGCPSLAGNCASVHRLWASCRKQTIGAVNRFLLVAHTEERRLQHIHVAVVDELREEPEEMRDHQIVPRWREHAVHPAGRRWRG